jgi:hypothetical protein
MLDPGIPDRDAWPDGVLDAVATFRQGDVVEGLPLFWWADPDNAVHDITKRAATVGTHERVVGPKDRAPYGMVTTQTCDLALEGDGRPKSAWVQLAPVFDATAPVGPNGEPSLSPGQIESLKKGSYNSKVWLANLPTPGVWYAELSFEVTVERGWLSKRQRIDGFADENAREQVGVRLAWLRSRPALDGNFTLHVQTPLVDALRKVKKRKDLFRRMHDQVLEVAIRPDSRLTMTAVDIVVLHYGVDDDVRIWWEEQLVIARANAQACGIDVIGARLVHAAQMSAAEYRGMITMPLNNISPNAAVWGWGED